jgi:hypothetical protein
MEEHKRKLSKMGDWFLETQGKKFNIELMDSEKDWTRETSSKYYDAIDREYQIDKVEYNFDKEIRAVNGSTAAQNKLNEARNRELEILRKKEKITQNDIDRANKVLELEKARIELQDAQANKNKMQLVRGADGSYSYQYTADLDAVAEKEQEILDLENELYNFDKEAL